MPAVAAAPSSESTRRPTPGITVTTRIARQSDLLPAGALALLVSLHRAVETGRQRQLALRQQRQAYFDRRRAAGFPRRHPRHPRGRLDGGADPGRIAGPPRRDHRPDRSEDGHQRAQFRRQGVHGRLRGFDLADLAQRAGRPAVDDRGGARHTRIHRAGNGQGSGQALRTASACRAGGADRAPAWLASGREARAGRWPARCRRPVRCGVVRLPQRTHA